MAELPDFLKTKHPLFEANLERWKRNESRLQGGEAVRSELARFSFEQPGSENYKARRDAAYYVNLPARMMEKFVGALSREAPRPGKGLEFGTLGEVRELPAQPLTRAEQVYFNLDGTGSDGCSWTAFFDAVQRRAGATGHRWLLVDVPSVPEERRGSLTLADEQRGQRPYVVEFSPTQVPNWHVERGTLMWLRIEVEERRPRMTAGSGGKDGKYTDKPETVHYLFVRSGYDVFGSKYSNGGWWKYDKEGTQMGTGDWTATAGEIPIVPLFYERSSETFSRGGLDALSALAVSMMNMNSAADHDAMVSGSRRIFALGVDGGAHKTVSSQIADGSLFIGVPAVGIEGKTPSLHDTGSASANAAIESRIEAKWKQAAFLAMDELKSGASASGLSRQVEFLDTKSPRLALMAREREAAENAALRFLQLRWGLKADGRVTWKTEFDLRPVVDEVRDLFSLMTEAGVSSPTLSSELVASAVKEKGLTAGTGVDLEAIKEEMKASQERRQQSDSLLGDFDL